MAIPGANRTANFVLIPPLPPTLNRPSVLGNTFACSVSGQTNVSYRVLSSIDLKDWDLLADHYLGPTFQFTDSVSPAAGLRFYRVEVNP